MSAPAAFDPSTIYDKATINAASRAASIIETSDGPHLYAQVGAALLRFCPVEGGWRLDPSWRFAPNIPPARFGGSATG